jgi:phosphoserine phosphatase
MVVTCTTTTGTAVSSHHQHSPHLSASERRAATRLIFRQADAVCFDVDSTVCEDEAIDELAKYLGVGDQIAAYTLKAMNGDVTFRQALATRLGIMKPSSAQLEAFALARTREPRLTTGKCVLCRLSVVFSDKILTLKLPILNYTFRCVYRKTTLISEYANLASYSITLSFDFTGIKELVRILHQRDVAVYLVSGGFRRLILPVAHLLGIPDENVFANVLQFDETGAYAGFDLTALTSESGNRKVGKPGVCGLLKERFGYKRLVMIGDGATDMEAAPPADAFIGFGGNQMRENVRRGSAWYVHGFDELIAELVANDQ